MCQRLSYRNIFTTPWFSLWSPRQPVPTVPWTLIVFPSYFILLLFFLYSKNSCFFILFFSSFIFCVVFEIFNDYKRYCLLLLCFIFDVFLLIFFSVRTKCVVNWFYYILHYNFPGVNYIFFKFPFCFGFLVNINNWLLKSCWVDTDRLKTFNWKCW